MFLHLRISQWQIGESIKLAWNFWRKLLFSKFMKNKKSTDRLVLLDEINKHKLTENLEILQRTSCWITWNASSWIFEEVHSEQGQFWNWCDHFLLRSSLCQHHFESYLKSLKSGSPRNFTYKPFDTCRENYFNRPYLEKPGCEQFKVNVKQK